MYRYFIYTFWHITWRNIASSPRSASAVQHLSYQLRVTHVTGCREMTAPNVCKDEASGGKKTGRIEISYSQVYQSDSCQHCIKAEKQELFIFTAESWTVEGEILGKWDRKVCSVNYAGWLRGKTVTMKSTLSTIVHLDLWQQSQNKAVTAGWCLRGSFNAKMRVWVIFRDLVSYIFWGFIIGFLAGCSHY